MQRYLKRYIILLAILSCFLAVNLWIYRISAAVKTEMDISKIPMNVDGWHAYELPVNERDMDILETRSVIIRKYSKGHDEIWMSIVYYKDSKVALHLPESCYTGQGSHIAGITRELLTVPNSRSFYANQLLLLGDKGNQVIIYYFMTPGLRTSSYFRMRWKMMINKFKCRSNSGALVKFSAIINQDPEQAKQIVKQFISKIDPLFDKYLP